MRNGLWQGKSLRAIILAATPLFCLCIPAAAQNAPAQDSDNSVVVKDNRPAQFDVTTARDLFKFDRFLDSHPQTADQLRSKPWLVTNYDFLQANPDLQAYLQAHPQLAQAISQNPAGFVDQEERFDNPTYRRDLAEFDRFLDSHPNIAQQLRSKPWLATNYDFEQSHPDLRAFLQAHPQLSQTAGQNPVAFMQDEQTFDTGPNPADRDVNPSASREFGREQTARVNRDRDFERRQSADFDRDRDRDFGQGRGTGVNREQNGINHGDLVVFDHFMDSHPEIAEQVRKNPSLLDNRQFVQSHPALQTFLQDHSQLRGAI